MLSLLAGMLLADQNAPQEVLIRTHAYTPPSAILHAQTNLVETRLIVRDARGHGVAGLHGSDLEVLDNGVPRPIASFTEMRSTGHPRPADGRSATGNPGAARDAALPKYITFFFDDLHIANGNLLFVKQSARRFIANGISPGEHLSIVTASGEGDDLDFTTDAQRFTAALERGRTHTRPVITGYCGVSPIDSYIFVHNLDGDIREAAIAAAMKCAPCNANEPPAQCRSKAYGIALTEATTTWEQIQAASLEAMAALGMAAKKLSRMSGARILVLTSPGFLFPPGLPAELKNFIDGALRWNITVHAIGAQGLEARMTGPKDMVRTAPYLMPLEDITSGTGGYYFKDSNDLAGAMEMAADPEVSYSIAFHAGEPDGKYHTLKIRLTAGHNKEDLQYRPAYFSPDPKKQISARARMDDAVFSKETLREIPATVALGAGEPKQGEIPISVRVSIDLKNMPFTLEDGRYLQQIVFLTALLDSKGGFLAGKESVMDLALTPEKLASMKKDGLKTIATLNAAPGVYQVRTIVREGIKGSLAAATMAVELRAR
jgi:VWFA-related protein